jgi:hypothetical protein
MRESDESLDVAASWSLRTLSENVLIVCTISISRDLKPHKSEGAYHCKYFVGRPRPGKLGRTRTASGSPPPHPVQDPGPAKVHHVCFISCPHRDRNALVSLLSDKI